MTTPDSTIAIVKGIRTRLFTCDCGQGIGVNDTKRRSNPEEWAMSVIRKQGWRAWKARKILCPDCVAKEDEKKMNKRTAIKITTVTEPEPLKAEPPRQPTPADNRRIHDAVDAAYDDKAGCYTKNHSDDLIAKALNVPRAWVSKIREDFFGPDLSEAERLKIAYRAELALIQGEMDEHRARLDKVIDDCMTTAATAENIKADLDKLTANLARKA